MSRTARPGRIALLLALAIAGCAVGQETPKGSRGDALGDDSTDADGGSPSGSDTAGDDSTGSGDDSTGSTGDDSTGSTGDDDPSTGTGTGAGTGSGAGGSADAGFDWSSLFPPPSSTSTPPPAASVDGASCSNLACWDVFDCAIFHPAEMGPCKFTKCEGFICKP